MNKLVLMMPLLALLGACGGNENQATDKSQEALSHAPFCKAVGEAKYKTELEVVKDQRSIVDMAVVDKNHKFSRIFCVNKGYKGHPNWEFVAMLRG